MAGKECRRIGRSTHVIRTTFVRDHIVRVIRLVACSDEDEDEEDEGDYEKDEVLDRENPLYESQVCTMRSDLMLLAHLFTVVVGNKNGYVCRHL